MPFGPNTLWVLCDRRFIYIVLSICSGDESSTSFMVEFAICPIYYYHIIIIIYYHIITHHIIILYITKKNNNNIPSSHHHSSSSSITSSNRVLWAAMASRTAFRRVQLRHHACYTAGHWKLDVRTRNAEV